LSANATDPSRTTPLDVKKIRPPLLRLGLLPRPRLLNAVDSALASAPLVVVTGVAGVGKTTLVAQWVDLQGTRTPVAWLTLDTRDNDPSRFWRCVCTALAVPCPAVPWAVRDEPTDGDVESLAEQLAGRGPLVLVLDDLQLIVDPVVLAQLDNFVGSLPDGVCVVLLSRNRPPLRLARRAAAGHVVELCGLDLLFTAEETSQVVATLSASTPVPETVRAIQDATGGWPVAVRLSAQLEGDRSPVPSPAIGNRTAAQARRNVADYLTEEVMLPFGPEVTAFLLDTCILDELTVPACNAVRDAHDSARLIAVLEPHDAFLIPVALQSAAHKSSWCHHAIVRDHLRLQLETLHPARWTTGHRRAAHYYTSVDLARAFAHAVAAPDLDLAADVLQRVLDRDAGRVVEPSTRMNWLEALPDEVIGARPKLRDAAIVLALALSRPDLTLRWIRARHLDDAAQLDTLLAELWWTQGVGDQRRMLEICQLAVQQMTPESALWSPVQFGLMAAASSLGDWTTAIGAGRRALVAVRESSVEAMPFQEGARSGLVMAYARAGLEQEAAVALRELDEWLDAAQAAGYTPHGYRARGAAVVAYHRGDVSAAATWDARETALFEGLPFFEVEALLDLLRVRRAAGDTERARELAVELRALVSRMADSGMYGAWLAAEEQALDLAVPAVPGRLPGPRHAPSGGQLAERLSDREEQVLRMLRSELSMPEIAGHLLVSYNTVKTHARMIYRKLGVNGRSAAVARGRQLGYL
jgi:LuxR family maltose regulon positive regulatory protein